LIILKLAYGQDKTKNEAPNKNRKYKAKYNLQNNKVEKEKHIRM